MSTLDRRAFLRSSAMIAVGAIAASCAQPTPQVIEKPVTVVVEKEVSVEKQVLQTVVVEKQVSVEKVVQQTVVVEKQVEKVVTATPSPVADPPMLAELVKAGKLPPLKDRLPEEPLIVEPISDLGEYGGTMYSAIRGASEEAYLRTSTWYDHLVKWAREGSQVLPNVPKAEGVGCCV